MKFKSLVFVTLLIVTCGPSEEEIQAQINDAVESALQTSSTTTTTLAPTTTTTTTSTTTTTLAPTTTTTTTSTTTTTLAPTTTTTTTSTTTTTLNTINETYSGSGDNLVFIPQYSQLVVAEIVGNQENRFFQVKPYLGEKPYSSLIITSDPYSGVTPLNFSGDNPDTLEVSAEGSWKIIIRSVLTTPVFSGSTISGTGDTVIQFPDNDKTYQDLTITGNQENGFFQVKPYACNGSPKSSLVITSDPYNGTVRSRSGSCYLAISAEGNWTLSR